MGARIEGDFKKLRESLLGLTDFNFSSLNKDIGEELVTQTMDRFDEQKGPDGESWPVSIRVSQGGGETLSDSGILKGSIHSSADSESVAVGTNLIYAAIHQFGGPIRIKNAKALKFMIGGKWINKKEVEIPKRSYLGVSDDDLEAINEIIEDHMEEHLGT